jgi:hypothetical protein
MEVSDHVHTPAALPPGTLPPVRIEQEAGWAPEPVWTLQRENELTPAWNRTPAV